MIVIKPPQWYDIGSTTKTKIFLAGSIEMGAADHWQAQVEQRLQDLDVIIFNPRRDDWDSSQEQSPDNPYFRDQVEWELEHLGEADIILMYLDPNTISPISLMELGYSYDHGNVVVCCPEGYFRRGNVQIFCERNKIPLYFNLLSGVRVVEEMIKNGASDN